MGRARFALESVKITERVSAKFRWLSFLAAWAVVGIHSGTSRWTSRPDWSDGVQAQIIGLFGFAVPLFFMISGYLLVYSYEKYGFIKLIRLKVKSLYVPCVLWMVLSEVLIIPIKLYCGEDVSAWTYLYAPLLVYENFSISFHLWYVRALLVVFLFSPIIWWLISTKARLCFSLVIIVGSLFLPSCVFHIGPYSVQYAKITVSSVLLGACLARLRNEERFGRIAVVISGLTLGVLLIMGFKLQAVPYKLVFAVLVWFGYDVLSDKVKIQEL